MEAAPSAGLGLEPDFPVLPLQDALRNGQPQAFAGAVRRVEAVKNLEDFVLMLRGDADAVVLDRIDRLPVLNAAADGDVAGPAGIKVFHGVVEQVGEGLVDLRGVAMTVGELADGEGCAGLLELKFHRLRNLGEHRFHLKRFDPQGGAAEPGEAEEAGQKRVDLPHASLDEGESFGDILVQHRLELAFGDGLAGRLNKSGTQAFARAREFLAEALNVDQR